MDLASLTKLQRKGFLILGIGAFLRLVSGTSAFGDIANIVMLFGLVHLSIHLWDTRNDISPEEEEEIRLFDEFLSADENRRTQPRDEIRAAYIAWRDSRHYSE